MPSFDKNNFKQIVKYYEINITEFKSVISFRDKKIQALF